MLDDGRVRVDLTATARRRQGARPRPGRRRSSPDAGARAAPASRSRSSPPCGSAARPAGWWSPRPTTSSSRPSAPPTPRGEPLLVLGGGSNLVVADEGFDGTVLQVATRGRRRRAARPSTRCRSRPAWTGTTWWRGPSTRATPGIEALSGIPGRVGAAPIQNVGAYGQEVAQTLAWVRAWTGRTHDVVQLAPGRLRLRLPRQRVQAAPTATSCWPSRSRSSTPRLGAPVRYAELARRARRRGRRAGAGGRRTAPRCSSCAAARAWCSTPTTTTPGAPARSSPTRPRRRDDAGRLLPDDAPRWPEPRRPGQDLGRLADRAGRLRQGLRRRRRPGCPPSTRSR